MYLCFCYSNLLTCHIAVSNFINHILMFVLRLFKMLMGAKSNTTVSLKREAKLKSSITKNTEIQTVFP
jgi:hypothetical protein